MNMGVLGERRARVARGRFGKLGAFGDWVAEAEDACVGEYCGGAKERVPGCEFGGVV